MKENHVIDHVDSADAEYDELDAQVAEDGVEPEVFGGLAILAHQQAQKAVGISPVRVPGVSVPALSTMLAWIRSAQPHEIDTLLEHVMIGSGGPEGPISILKAKAVMLGYESVDADFNKWKPGTISLANIGCDDKPPMVWFGIYKGALTLINGQSGAGKSSFTYNMVLHAAVGKELWGVPFPGPQRVFYIDPENKGAVRSEKLKRIAQSTGISLEEAEANIFFHNAEGMDLSDPMTAKHLGDMAIQMECDGIVLDPIANIFGTVNENDNAEASRQMKLLTDMLGRTGCWILAVHHTGKSEEGGARGASARHGASFVVLDLRLAKEAEDVNDDYDPNKKEARKDLVRLRKVKDRFNGARASLFLKMGGQEAEDCFFRVTYDDWMREARNGGGMTAADQAMILVRGFFEVEDVERQFVTIDAVVTHLSTLGPNGPAQSAVKTAATKLAADGFLSFKKAGKGGTRYLYMSAMNPEILAQAEAQNMPGGRAVAADRREDDDIEPEFVAGSGLQHNDGNALPIDDVPEEYDLSDTLIDDEEE